MLEAGTIVKSHEGKDVEVVRCIHQGGTNDVFEVLYDQKRYAMKVYKDKYREKYTIKDFWLLENKATALSMHKNFVWPCDFVEDVGGGYSGGVLMPLIGEEYFPLTEILKGTSNFSSFQTRINAAIHLVAEMRALHSKGYCYANLDPTKLLVNPKTGELRMCDVDNIVITGEPVATNTSWEYTVPEIDKYNKKSNVELDNYAVSVLIFCLLFNVGPYEGKEYIKSWGQSPKARLFMFSNDFFMFWDEGNYNRPVEGIHQYAIDMWNYFPQHIKDLFLHDFQRHASDYLLRYTPALTWLDNLQRLKTHTTSCPNCQGAVFLDEYDEHWCPICHTAIETPLSIRTNRIGYTIPIIPGNMVFKEQIAPVNLDELSTVALRVCKHKDNPEIVLLKNILPSKLIVNIPGKGLSELPAGYSIRPVEGVKLRVDNVEVIVQASKERHEPFGSGGEVGGMIAPLEEDLLGDLILSDPDESLISPSAVDATVGHRKCELLKIIRKSIAEANGIPYEISECTNQGACTGTCPYCDAESADLRKKLEEKAEAGEQVVFPQVDISGLADKYDVDIYDISSAPYEIGGWDVLP